MESVRAIVCTHHHLDHISDLGAALFLRVLLEESAPLVLAGPHGHRLLVAGLTDVHGTLVADAHGSLDVVDLGDGDALSVGPFALEVRHVAHSDGALGVRVTCDGRTLAFSGDSGPCDSLVALLSGADLCLVECSYPASRPTKSHLNTRSAAEMAVAAGVTRLVLTHFYPQCDDVDIASEVRAAGYEADLELAVDGAIFVV
jgi:ribonuclease BN (tRNA processing enzyme)